MGTVQEQVQDTIDALVGSGAERALQVCVYHRGEMVVDAVAGDADPATGRAMTPGTPVYGWSIGKGVTATLAHMLAERGLFGYDTPVAAMWPEFGKHGKDAVTVRHVLNHTAGVPGVPLDTTPEAACDWDAMCGALAEAELWWEPGTRTGYHAYTFGYIVGEIVRRVTGKPLPQVLLEELAGPLGVAGELYFGMPADQQGRLAPLEDAPRPEDGGTSLEDMPADLPMFRAGPVSLLPTAELGNRTDILAADIPAGAKTSARAIARVYAALLGDVDGVRPVSPERLREAAGVSFAGTDEIFGNPARWGLGYALGLPADPPDAPATVFGMGGAGGSYAYGDTATGTAFALCKNRLSSDFATAEEVIATVRKALAGG